MDEIPLPLKRGTLDDVSDEAIISTGTSLSTSTISTGAMTSMEVDTLNSEVAQAVYEKEAKIEIDYRDLEDVSGLLMWINGAVGSQLVFHGTCHSTRISSKSPTWMTASKSANLSCRSCLRS